VCFNSCTRIVVVWCILAVVFQNGHDFRSVHMEHDALFVMRLPAVLHGSER
jgi:hypothetical protein